MDFLAKSNIIKESEIGVKDLAVFILNKSPKALSDLISTTWKMNAAPETTAREDCNLDVCHPQSCCWVVCNQLLREMVEACKTSTTKQQNIRVFFRLRLAKSLLKRHTEK